MQIRNDQNFVVRGTVSCGLFYEHFCIVYIYIEEERTRLREGVPYVKLYRKTPKHLYSKLNGLGDNGQRSLKL